MYKTVTFSCHDQRGIFSAKAAKLHPRHSVLAFDDIHQILVSVDVDLTICQCHHDCLKPLHFVIH